MQLTISFEKDFIQRFISLKGRIFTSGKSCQNLLVCASSLTFLLKVRKQSKSNRAVVEQSCRVEQKRSKYFYSLLRLDFDFSSLYFKMFLCAQAMQGASSSLILQEDGRRERGRRNTISFFLLSCLQLAAS